MANTYQLIASATAGASTSSLDFTSIPATYTDLLLKVNGRTTDTSQIRDYFLLRFNSSASGYSRTWLTGYDGGAVTSAAGSTDTYGFCGTVNGFLSQANTFGNSEIYIPSYASSVQKMYHADCSGGFNSTTTYMMNITNVIWNNTAAITSISLFPANGNVSSPSGNWAQNSTAYLYGIKNS